MESRSISRSLVLTTFAFIIIIVLPIQSEMYSRAQVFTVAVNTSPSFLYLGYGPSVLTPAQQGSPIYTINDSLWIFSSLDQPMNLALTDPITNSTSDSTLPPSTATSIYTFSTSDSFGPWTLTVTLQNSSYYIIEIPFVPPSENTASAGLSEYSIQNGEINLGFSASAPNSYDLEGCLTSSTDNSTLFVAEPTNLGSGRIAIAIDAANNSAILSATGIVSTTFSFWFDIEYSYGYTASAANETISRNAAIARSSTVLFNSTSTQDVSIPILSNLRVGRYVIRGYFDSSSGFANSETSALLMYGGQWFWLSSCNPFSITGSTFSKQVSLTASPSTWPTSLLFMYQSRGIEGYSIVPLQINLARLDFLGQPGNVKLSDFTYSVANNTDVEASGTFSGSVYVIAKTYPVSLTVIPSIGTESLAPIEINISQALTDSRSYIPIGKLTVIVLNNSRPDTGTLVGVSNQQGASLSGSIGSGGNTSFFLPSGLYNITISKSGLARTGNATVVIGSNTIVQFSLISSSVPSAYLEFLLIPLVIGLGLNVWAWLISPRRSKLKFANS